MAADHVAQQRAQVVGDLFGEHPGAVLLAAGARDRGPLESDRLHGPLGEREPPLGGGAERGEAPGQHPARRPLGLEHRPQREEVVAQRLEQIRALAAHLETTQGPGQLVAVGGAARDEVAERPQLVLLLHRHEQHPVRAPAGADRQRRPRPAADPRPAERRERDAPVAEQAQRAQEIAKHIAAAFGRALGVGVGARQGDDHVARLGALAGARLRRQAVDGLRLGDRQAGGQRQLRARDRHALQQGDDRHLRGACQRGAVEPLQRGLDALGPQLEVGLVGEHVAEQSSDRDANPGGGLQAHDVLADAGEITVEPLEARQRAARGLVLRKPFELAPALGDELSRQGAVAVERRPAACCTALLLTDLERDLGAGGQVRLKPLGGGPQELPKRAVELDGAHWLEFKARRPAPARRSSACSGTPLGDVPREVPNG